jgi:hypothetical protein
MTQEIQRQPRRDISCWQYLSQFLMVPRLLHVAIHASGEHEFFPGIA